ncbi:c-type cytochrome [Thalassospiraceae bacterium LMO-SO8]|nr:c-type cytochrome [Alphaproteobacteria bacterium LMO-S08]WND77169.1 c-type cytochrome [Thalassospiraceae bacterium LMO-SO8]
MIRVSSLAGVAAFAVMLAAHSARAGMIDESGLKPWENCALCHSLDGVSRMAKFPKLAGQVPVYIEKQIRDFRAAKRTNDGEQMQGMAGLIAEKDIPVVAGYFAGLPPPPPADPPPDGERLAGQTLYHKGDAARGLPACVSCHGKDKVAASGAPRLEAQHADYVVKQLTDFRSGDRANDPGGVMAGVAAKLSDADIRAVGGYLAAEPRN